MNNRAIDIDSKDAWDEGYALIQGINDLLSMGAGSDEGISPEGCKVMNLASHQLYEQMKIVDALFSPTDTQRQEGGRHEK